MAPFHCPACTPPPPHHGGVTGPCGGLHDVRTDGSCAGGGVLTVSSSPRAGAFTTYLFRQVHACRMRKCLHVRAVRAYGLVSWLRGTEGAQGNGEVTGVRDCVRSVHVCVRRARGVFQKIAIRCRPKRRIGGFLRKNLRPRNLRASIAHLDNPSAVPQEMAHVRPQCTGRVQIPACHVCIGHVSDAFA